MKKPAVAGISNPGHLACQCSAIELDYTGQSPALTTLYVYCTGDTEVSQSHTRQPLTVCAVRTWLGLTESSPSEENSFYA